MSAFLKLLKSFPYWAVLCIACSRVPWHCRWQGMASRAAAEYWLRPSASRAEAQIWLSLSERSEEPQGLDFSLALLPPKRIDFLTHKANYFSQVSWIYCTW